MFFAKREFQKSRFRKKKTNLSISMITMIFKIFSKYEIMLLILQNNLHKPFNPILQQINANLSPYTLGKSLGNVVSICWRDQIDVTDTIIWEITMVMALGIQLSMVWIMYVTFVHSTCVCMWLYFVRATHIFQSEQFPCIMYQYSWYLH